MYYFVELFSFVNDQYFAGDMPDIFRWVYFCVVIILICMLLGVTTGKLYYEIQLIHAKKKNRNNDAVQSNKATDSDDR